MDTFSLIPLSSPGLPLTPLNSLFNLDLSNTPLNIRITKCRSYILTDGHERFIELLRNYKLESQSFLSSPTTPPTHHPPTTHLNFSGTSRLARKLIFGMQPYFDPTRKNISKKNGRRPQKKK